MRPSDVLDGCGGGLEVGCDEADATKHRLVDLVNVLRSIRRQAATSDAAQESLLYRTTSCFCCSGPLAWSQRRLRTPRCGSSCCRRPPSGLRCKCEAGVKWKQRPVQLWYEVRAIQLGGSALSKGRLDSKLYHGHAHAQESCIFPLHQTDRQTDLCRRRHARYIPPPRRS